jgi:hypothetical protein
MTNDHNQAERAAPCPLCHTDQVQICRDSNNPAKDTARCRACKCTGPLLIWNQRRSPAVGEDGLPPLPEKIGTLYTGNYWTGLSTANASGKPLCDVYTAEQVRQAQREAVAAIGAGDERYAKLVSQVHYWMDRGDRAQTALDAAGYEIAALRAQLALQSAPNVGIGEWVSVTDRLPPDGDVVLAWAGDHVAVERWMERHESPVSWSSATVPIGPGWDDHEFEDITHWMPLPSAPQQASQKGEDDVG